ncbi:hypothetical protein J4H92_04625 [Leucobacter weissii]|uniref:SbsA Ig-like domain-containing protein n=1 Tax=Leucobacter weissii TaxID=1983706 RepID=A0A939MII7_9MICO|nr:hypothetical protein [Leucobacter weissii]MBO1901231.1 hypothetical protein [Leucobacter weissii]
MSTDAAAPQSLPGSERSDEPRGARSRFRIVSAALFAALIALGLLLAGAGMLQPPRLERVESNPFALVESPGARVVLQLNQPIDAPAEGAVSIDPEVPLSVESDGARVTVRFLESLDYAAAYRLRVSVTGAFTGVRAEVEHELRTPDISVYTLLRGSGGEGDRILADELIGGGGGRVVTEAGRIQEFALLSDRVVTIELDDGGGARLASAPLSGSGGGVAQLTPLPLSSITELRAEAGVSFAGAVVSGEHTDGSELDQALVLWDLSGAGGAPFVAMGEGGAPARVVDWRFVPGTTGVVALTDEQRLLMLNPSLDQAPMLLGRFDALDGFLPGGNELVLEREGEQVILDLATTDAFAVTPTAIGLPSPPAGPDAVSQVATDIVDRVLLDSSTAIDRVVDPSGAPAELRRVTPEGDAALFSPASERSSLGALCRSPNGRAVSVEVISAEGRPDGSPTAQRFSGTTTVFLNAATGETLRSMNGALSSWC